MRILITGATGFVGTWLTKKLVSEGHTVRIIHRENSDLSPFDGLNIETRVADINDKEKLKTALEDVNVVFHLAGYVGYSRAQRKLMEKINVEGTRNIVELCQNNKNIERFIHMSSVVAIGASFDGTPLNEKSTYNIANLNLGYFETKRQAEEIVKFACMDGSLNAVMVNPSTIYGPGDSKKGSRGVQYKVLQGKFPFYTPGGVSVVHIEDVIYCLIQAWRLGETGERYIISGENILLKELFEIIAARAGVKPPPIKLPKFILRLIGLGGDLLEKFGLKGPLNSETYWVSILYHWFDSQKAQEAFGLKPKAAKEAIHASVDWTLKHNPPKK